MRGTGESWEIAGRIRMKRNVPVDFGEWIRVRTWCWWLWGIRLRLWSCGRWLWRGCSRCHGTPEGIYSTWTRSWSFRTEIGQRVRSNNWFRTRWGSRRCATMVSGEAMLKAELFLTFLNWRKREINWMKEKENDVRTLHRIGAIRTLAHLLLEQTGVDLDFNLPVITEHSELMCCSIRMFGSWPIGIAIGSLQRGPGV